MTYFRINLNQLEDTSAVLRRKRLRTAGFVALAALFVAVAVPSVLVNLRLHEKKSEFSATVDDLESQISALEDKESYIGEEDVLDLYALTQERIFWTEKLEALAVVVDTTIALTGIAYSSDKLTLTGITRLADTGSRFTAISAFIDILKSQPTFANDFTRIEFQSSDRMTFMNRDIMQFEVVCFRE
jgi:Tfp pilus assembly protein PilN